MSDGGSDVEIVGQKGDDVMRNAPHARFDCLHHQFADGAEAYCQQCFCWCCDVPAKECAVWSEHCKCDGSVGWVPVRQRRKRELDAMRAERLQRAAPGVLPNPLPSAAEVDARYTAAAAAAAGIPQRKPVTAEEEEASKEGEDEEDEDLCKDLASNLGKGGARTRRPVARCAYDEFSLAPRRSRV